MQAAPLLLDHLTEEDRDHFASVRELLDSAGVAYEVDPTLVRGLDYYTRTVFEFSSDALGAQSGVGGGGRYDGLMEIIGGPPTPGMGWAAGSSGSCSPRRRRPVAQPPLDLYVAYAGPEYGAAAFRLAADARRAGHAARLELGGRSLKGQLKQADRAGARYVAILGDEGTSLKDMESGEQKTVEPDTVMHHIRGEAPVRPPRPNAFRDAWCGELRAGDVDSTVRVAGWVHRRRDHGGLIFIDLRDRSGLVQLVFHPETAAEAHALAERLRSEHVVSATGKVVRREEGNVNPKLATGEIELEVTEAEPLAESLDAAVPGRRGDAGRRAAAPAPPRHRPAPRRHAARDGRSATRSTARSATTSTRTTSSRSRRRS